jgi:hypothetical protein
MSSEQNEKIEILIRQERRMERLGTGQERTNDEICNGSFTHFH